MRVLRLIRMTVLAISRVAHPRCNSSQPSNNNSSNNSLSNRIWSTILWIWWARTLRQIPQTRSMPHLKLWMTSIDNLNRCLCNSRCRQTHSVAPPCNNSLQQTLVEPRAVSSHNSSRVPNSRTTSTNRCKVNSRCLNNHSNRSGRPPLAQVETPNNNLDLTSRAFQVKHRLSRLTICLTACSSIHSQHSTRAAVSLHSTLVCKCHSNSLKIKWTVVLAGSRTRRSSHKVINITVDWSTWLLLVKAVSSFKALSNGDLLCE